MQLTDGHKVIFRFCKQVDIGNWHDLVKFGLGEIYHYDMRLIDVHHIVFNLYIEMFTEPRFEISSSKVYDLLLVQANDWEVQCGNKMKAFTAEEIIESQLEKMLMSIRLSRVDWIKHQYI